jgi:hypothetical protein
VCSAISNAHRLLQHNTWAGCSHAVQGGSQAAAAARDPAQYGITPELERFVCSLTYSTFRSVWIPKLLLSRLLFVKLAPGMHALAETCVVLLVTGCCCACVQRVPVGQPGCAVGP